MNLSSEQKNLNRQTNLFVSSNYIQANKRKERMVYYAR